MRFLREKKTPPSRRTAADTKLTPGGAHKSKSRLVAHIPERPAGGVLWRGQEVASAVTLLLLPSPPDTLTSVTLTRAADGPTPDSAAVRVAWAAASPVSFRLARCPGVAAPQQT